MKRLSTDEYAFFSVTVQLPGGQHASGVADRAHRLSGCAHRLPYSTGLISYKRPYSTSSSELKASKADPDRSDAVDMDNRCSTKLSDLYQWGFFSLIWLLPPQPSRTTGGRTIVGAGDQGRRFDFARTIMSTTCARFRVATHAWLRNRQPPLDKRISGAPNSPEFQTT
jgi:hypothetical protein